MRWPFGRSSRPADGPPATASGNRPPIDRPHDAWRSLPAVQRASGQPPTVAPAAPFAASLATRQPPALALAPLGHEVSPLGSPGIVVGLVAPSGAAISGRPDLPIQRPAAEPGRQTPEAAAWSSFESTDPTPESVPAGAPVLGAAGPEGGSAGTLQRLAAPAPRLTSASTTSLPTAPAGTFDLRPAAQRSEPASPAPALPSVQAMAAVPAAVPAPAPAAASAVASPARRPTLGQARRLGLGVPLSSSAEHTVQRTALPVAGPGWTSLGPTPGSAPATGSAGAEAANGAPGRPSMGGSPEGITGGPAAPRPAPPALTVVRPTSIQRLLPDLPGGPRRSGLAGAPAGRSAGSAGSDLAVPADAAGEGFRTGTGDSGPAQLPLVALTPAELPDGGLPAAQRLLDAPLGGQPIRVITAGSLLLAAAGDEAPGSAPERPAGGPEPAVARLVAETGRSGATATLPRTVQAAQTGAPARSDPGAQSVLRMVASARPAPGLMDPAPILSLVPAPSVQRAVEINEVQVNASVPDPSPAGGQAGQAAGSVGQSTGTAASSSTGDKDRELDDLARRLYGRLRTRLAAELLADRERAGIITDLR